MDIHQDHSLSLQTEKPSEPYEYIPLGKDEIRLATLLPGGPSSSIRILLKTTLMKGRGRLNLPIYEALSYAWGSVESPVRDQIRAPGIRTITVTRNLADSLPYLRYKDKPRVFWIDAICVNQQDLAERSQQVQRMAEIYRRAQCVVAWLGPTQDDSSYAVKILSDLNSKVIVNWVQHNMIATTQYGSDKDWSDLTKVLPYGEREALAIYHLFKRSWFERLWTWQEIWSLCDATVLLCGFDAIDWESFRTAVYCIYYKDLPQSTHRPVETLPGSVWLLLSELKHTIFQLCKNPFDRSLEDIIYQTQGSICSDPRDRVYAMLGLSTSGSTSEIKPDYSQSISQVYRDAVIKQLEHFGDCKILQSCEHERSQTKMPTWVPNWSTRRESTPIELVSAAGESSAEIQYVGEEVLRVVGVCTAIIDSAEVMDFGNNLQRNISELRRVALIYPMADVQYVGGGSMLDAFCRTICGDVFGDRYIPPDVNYLRLEHAKNVVAKVIGTQEASDADLSTNETVSKLFTSVLEACKGRSYFQTEEGHIGLAPKAAKLGDDICVILGCESLMCLRYKSSYKSSRQYQIVGECYLHGFMQGESLLGPLPDHIRPVYAFWNDSEGYTVAYLDSRQDEVRRADPRLAIPSEWPGVMGRYRRRHVSKLSCEKMTSVYLKRQGVSIRSFDLI